MYSKTPKTLRRTKKAKPIEDHVSKVLTEAQNKILKLNKLLFKQRIKNEDVVKKLTKYEKRRINLELQ